MFGGKSLLCLPEFTVQLDLHHCLKREQAHTFLLSHTLVRSAYHVIATKKKAITENPR